MKGKKNPERINLTASEAEALKSRIASNSLTESDLRILTHLITFNFWLQEQLQLAKLSIHKLRGLFGFKTEKKTPKIL